MKFPGGTSAARAAPWLASAALLAAGCGGFEASAPPPQNGLAVQSAQAASAAMTEPENAAEGGPGGDFQAAPAASQAGSHGVAGSAAGDAAGGRVFAIEGPNGARRISFDDLDLFKLLAMDPVTEDCVERMPAWLRDLSGKRVRIRGYMKPGLLTEGIPQFVFVRDTGLCCFGPKGKVHDMINVMLRPGLTTRYIELTPFDVEGTFQIELLTLDDMIAGLYHMEDAVILPIRPSVGAPVAPRGRWGAPEPVILLGLLGLLAVCARLVQRSSRLRARLPVLTS
jgi:hypothetical protein